MLDSLLYRWNEVMSRCRLAFLKARGVQAGPGCKIGAGVSVLRNRPQANPQVVLGREVTISDGALLHCYGGPIVIEDWAYIGPHSIIYGHGGVRIGKNTLLGPACHLISANHGVPAPGTPIRSMPNKAAPINIGEDVWLGARVTVLAGVTIGDGCVVGAGAVVTKDLPPNTYALGVPARVVKNRE